MRIDLSLVEGLAWGSWWRTVHGDVRVRLRTGWVALA